MGLRRKFFRKFCLGFTLSKSISSLSNVEQRFDGARIIEVHRRQLLGGNGAIAMASSALNVHEMRQKCVMLKFCLRLRLRPRPSWGSLRRCHTPSRVAGSWNPSRPSVPQLSHIWRFILFLPPQSFTTLGAGVEVKALICHAVEQWCSTKTQSCSEM